MTKRLKVLLTILVVVILAAIGGLFYYQKILKSSADVVSPYTAFGHEHGQNSNAAVALLKASPTVVVGGGTITLTWSSTNATGCMAMASENEIDWSGILPTTSGTKQIKLSENLSAFDKLNVFSLLCTDVPNPSSLQAFDNVYKGPSMSEVVVIVHPAVACKPATVVAAGTGPAKTVAVGGKFNIPIKITNNNPVGSACAAVFGLVVYPNAGWSTYGYSSNLYIPFKNATYRVINVAPAQSVVTSVTLNTPTIPATGTKIMLKVDDYPAGKLITTFSTLVNVTGATVVNPTPTAVSKYTITEDFGFSGGIPSGTIVGNISPKGTVTVNSGASQTFTITPVSGYKIINVIVDGQIVALTVTTTSASTYTFSNVTANHGMTINFAKAN